MIPCATCGAEPVGAFSDGSPRYDPRTCLHPAIMPGDDLHPDYIAALRSGAAEKLVVELTEEELAEALDCGKARLAKAKRKKSKDYLGLDSLDSHVMGARGERAFSKFIGEPWVCTLNGYGGAPDVRGCQIRTVPKTSGDLKVKENDPDHRPCILVVDHAPRFWMRGWLLASEARRLGTIADPGNRGRPATFVPPSKLRPMQELLHHPKVRAAMNLPPEGMT